MNGCKQLIRFDWAAKRILRDKANFDVLEGFVTVLLKQEIKIQEILESEGNQDSPEDKFNRVDIMARNEKGELIIIEIQLTRMVHYLERILYGVGKALTDHIKLGEDYDKVKKVYSISILYFDIGDGDDYVYHGRTNFHGLHTGRPFQLSERDREMFKIRIPEEVFPEYYLICVNDFNKVATTPLEEWLDYLKNGNVRSDTSTPGLKEAGEKLNYLSMDPGEKRAYESYMYGLMDEKESIDAAILEGRAEGMAEGLAQGLAQGLARGRDEGEHNAKIEIARKLLANGITPEAVSGITGLSAGEIKSL